MRKPIDIRSIFEAGDVSGAPRTGLSIIKDDRSAPPSFSPTGGEGAPKGRMRGPFVSLPEPAPRETAPHPALWAAFSPRTGRRTGGEADAFRSRNPHTLRWAALILAPGIVIASLMPAAAQMAPATPNPWTAGAGAAVTNSVIGMSAGVVAGMALAPQAAAPGVVYVVPTRQPKPDPDDIGPKASDAIGPPPPPQGPVNYVTPPTVVQVPAYYGSGSDGGAVSPSYGPAYGGTSYGGQVYGGQAYGDGQAYGTQGTAPYGGQGGDPNAPATAAPQNYVAATPPAPWSADWYSYCAGRYPSFNPQTGNYTTSDGKTYFCR